VRVVTTTRCTGVRAFAEENKIDDFASSESLDSKYGCDRVRQAAVDGSGVKVVTSGTARQGFSLIKEFGFVLFINFLKI
jgi:pyruvate/2-oxoglutarate/acetoin dehydrogenase E1 component